VGTKNIGITSSSLEAILRNQNIYVKNCGNFPGLDYFFLRVSVGSYVENQAFLNVLDTTH
jgi:histidinol-phosphate/aromatic aminotransferase/cobyric acid decarboxylase-like protein